VQWAYREIGKPYQWAAAGPDSFDCSGLTQYVWGKAGVYLGHYTGDQWNEGMHVSRDQVQPGDLVFFAYNTSQPSTIHHVGIYVGGGEMIDAPYTGAYVRKEPAFRSDYIGAVRP
jgi:cell wall-associated NlpC family hydrolase